ncbi:MAG: hypothetical protein CVT64_06150 [Actinobacteria bacterium HGW-Actinobacteria-4]|nr:MAG: hypothetical protein CVT64_06150 [Actinobacteria bacterium HGW-Actinobacteria-4]
MSSVELEPQDLPDVAPDNHGKTYAGWATTTGFVVATLAAGIGLSVSNMTLIWVGIGVAVAAIVAGIVLRALGYGQPRQ